ncbi:MAG: hypothetical protein WKF93_03225 [Acidimicrobiales bacterium]
MTAGESRGSTTIAPLAVARAVTAAALAVPGVVALDHGRLGEFATHGRGGRISGVAVRGLGAEQRVAVRIVVDGTMPVLPIADAVRDAVAATLGDHPGGPPPIDVHIADVRDAPSPDPVPASSGPPPTTVT